MSKLSQKYLIKYVDDEGNEQSCLFEGASQWQAEEEYQLLNQDSVVLNS